MTYEIIWKGNANTNSSDRGAHIPFVNVCHISAGTMSSMDSWFTDAGNTGSSAHFGVSKAGAIHQYVDIRRMAWANGIGAAEIAASNTPVVHDNPGVNPNLYSVSIEHEGTDGDLTEAQFAASVWLHRFIRDEIVRIYGAAAYYELDEYHVIGHRNISKAKPACPGVYFPFARLYEALAELEADELKLDVGVAETVINTWLSPAWFDADKAATNAKDEAEALEHRKQRAYIHWLADELRRGAGLT